MNAFPKIKEFVTKYPFSKKFFWVQNGENFPIKKRKEKKNLVLIIAI
jgi:hypothetical protein